MYLQKSLHNHRWVYENLKKEKVTTEEYTLPLYNPKEMALLQSGYVQQLIVICQIPYTL